MITKELMKKKRNRVPWIVLCIFTGYMCLYLFTFPTNLPAGDEAIMIGVADRIADHGFSQVSFKKKVKLNGLRLSDDY
jgi:hypothetical protein